MGHLIGQLKYLGAIDWSIELLYSNPHIFNYEYCHEEILMRKTELAVARKMQGFMHDYFAIF